MGSPWTEEGAELCEGHFAATLVDSISIQMYQLTTMAGRDIIDYPKHVCLCLSDLV